MPSSNSPVSPNLHQPRIPFFYTFIEVQLHRHNWVNIDYGQLIYSAGPLSTLKVVKEWLKVLPSYFVAGFPHNQPLGFLDSFQKSPH